MVQSQAVYVDEPGSLSPSAHQTHWCALAMDVSSQKLRGHVDASAAEVPVAHTPELANQNLPPGQVQPLEDDVASTLVQSLTSSGQIAAAASARCPASTVPAVGRFAGVMQQHKR